MVENRTANGEVGNTLKSLLKTLGPIRRFKRDDIIYEQDGRPDHLVLLRGGIVSLNRGDSEGDVSSVPIISPGIMGIEVIRGHSSYEATAQVFTSECLVQLVEASQLPQVLEKPHLSTYFLQLVSKQILLERRYNWRKGKKYRKKSLSNYIAEVLTDLSSKSSRYGSTRVTHENISRFLGVSREHVTENIGEVLDEYQIHPRLNRLTLGDLAPFQMRREESS